MSGYTFHPAVQRWLGDTFGAPTEPQALGWPAIQAGRHTLIAAPTGSGKTLAAFLAAIDALVRQGLEGTLEDGIQVLYVSPLKALSNDIERNLRAPLAGIGEALSAMGLPRPAIRTAVRTGDTPATERAAMLRRPPHIFVTTPESFYILITSEKARGLLRSVRTVIVDEIHAVTGDKRGAHLALSLERLAHLTARPPVRIGLSATQRPIEEVARFLVGGRHIGADGRPDCVIVDVGHRRRIDLGIELPNSPLETVMSGEVWGEIYQRLAELSAQHRTTLVFVNTRAMSERVARALSGLLGEEHVATHHGSLSREKRLDAEQRLKAGTLRVMVATASLELGIDIGAVDLVCQLGTTRAIATFLQRAGRSGHFLGGLPKARLFPLSRDELLDCAALLESLQRGELENLHIPQHPLDILAQQIVAMVACEEWDEAALLALVRSAWPFRDLSREDYEAVLRMLAEGYSSRVGRRAAYLHRDAVNGRLRPRKGARLTAITCGGAIPDNADYQVVLDHNALFIGTVNEDFAIESIPGDIFQLGNSSWRILRVEPGKVRVEDAQGLPPTIPFWLGEAPGRTAEASAAVGRLRREVAENLRQSHDAALAHLIDVVGVSARAAQEITDYLDMAHKALGVMPTQETLVAERFFDQAGDMHLVVHAPFGSRLNRAWGLALRKRFCQRFNFELQAAATEDAIVLSLGPTHSFPLEEVFRYLHPNSVRDLLVQALLAAPMFQTRWRWNVTRALAVLRRRGGQKTPPALQRLYADDLLTLAFPDQVACQENLSGPRQIPDHPLVTQTIDDCLHEAMDIDALAALLNDIVSERKTLVARDVVE
ncbi:MAG: DEAD/DEAH box helicase, partial [Candidatus Lambdaproteobacteria bacterium]|nr:DEAD/DEAH box helicase [Candidatus Lambdaproteobacteria bacterium]